MIANKWYCIAQTGTFDSGCTINVSFDSYVIQFSASVKYGSSAINITRCELPLSANLSLRLRESNGLWSVDLLSNNDITPEIVVADSPYWVAANSVAGAGNIILTIKDISKDFNTETGGSGGGLDENALRDFLDKYGYTRAKDFWKYETTGGGAIHTDYHIIVDGGGAFGGAELGGGGESGGGGISEFYIQLGEGGQKYKLGNSGLPNVVQIPKYPVVPTNVSEFYNDAGYIGGEQAALIFSRISEVEARVEKLEKLWWVDENGNLHTTYNIVVEGGGAFGTGASVDAGGSGGLGRVVLVNDSGTEFTSDENGIVRIPDYINKIWFDAQKFATQSWVLSKGYVSESVLAPIREDITALKGDVVELKSMWTIKDGKLYTTYSIVVEGGGAFGQGASDSGEIGVGKTILITPSGLRYETNDDGYVPIPEWASQDWVNGKGFATQTWVLSKGFLTENSADLLYAKRAELDDINETLAELVKMWRLEDGKLFTDYSIVVKGGGAFGEGSESGGGSTGGLGQITIRNQAGQEYKTDANGVVIIPTYLTSNALDGYATQQWVESKKYLTSVPTEYITETELASKGYAVASEIAKTYATIESLNTTNTNLATVTAGLANVVTTVNALSKNFVNGVAKEAAKVSHALTFGSKTYDGSIARTILASDLDAVTLSGEQVITGAKTFGSLITANGGIKIPHTASLKIGDITLVEENGALKVLGNLVVTGGGAFGTGSTSGGGTSGGLGSVTIRTEGGIEYKSNSNGVVTVPNWITASSLNGYATEQYVTSRGYITGISSKMVTDALGYTPYNSANFTKATIKSTLGIADWALAASKPSYSWSEVSGKPTFATVATSGKYSDLSGVPSSLPASDVYAWAKAVTKPTYTASEVGALPLIGGRLTGTLRLQRDTEQNYIVFEGPNNTARGYLGFAGDNNPIYIPKEANVIYPLIHSGNIGSQSVDRAIALRGIYPSVTSTNDFYNTEQLIKYHAGFSPDFGNVPSSNYWQNGLLEIGLHSGGASAQFFFSADKRLYYRSRQTDAWHGVAYLTDNVASATKLQTARTIWGQSFDGTADVSGILRLYDSNGYHANILGNTTGITLDTWRDDVGYFPIKLAPNGGNVLIGTTTDNGYKLDVNGTSKVRDKAAFGHTILADRYNGQGNTAGAALIVNKGGDYFGVGASSSIVSNISFGWVNDLEGTWKKELVTINASNNIILNQGVYVSATDSANTARGILELTTSQSRFIIGYGVASAGYNTSLQGNNIEFAYGTSHTVGMKLTSGGNILMGTTEDNGARLHINTSAAYVFHAVTTIKSLGIARFLAPNATTGVTGGMVLDIGVASSTYNSGNIAFRYHSSGNAANFISLGLYGKDNILNVFGSGNVAIGTTDSNPTYKLDVQGGDVRFTGNLAVYGGGAFGSDVRYKDILDYTNIDLATIADAPLFTYQWNDREDNKVYLGTSAQYWMETTFKDAVNTSNPNFYHLDYGALGVGLAIATARKVVDHEERIATLEKENKELKKKLNKYETLWHN